MPKSLDTNILVYAANPAAPEHSKARALVERVQRERGDWLLSSQVLWEFYRAVRNPAVIRPAISAREAVERVRMLRSESGMRECSYEPRFFEDVAAVLSRSTTGYRATHDVLIGITLLRNGVTEFYTRKPSAFSALGFDRVIDPIA